MTDKRFFILPLFAIILFCAAGRLQQEPFNVLKQHFENGDVLHAEFKYEYKDTFTHQTSTNTGTLWISRKQYKVVNPPKTIFVDGKTSKVYDGDRNRLIISKYVKEEDDFAPSRFLNGIDSTYTLVEQKLSGNEYVIKLESQDSFSLYKSITIKLNKQYVPGQIKAVDQSNNIITTTFIDASFIKNKRNFFYITYPDDAKVIDLRK
ncbi:MAG TPA: outer membrane lipoprotein carrier protein LolA [Balneolaceae bacterium]|nr:outer membrane lipoprotein carrier protein LolA [Balneolaceae bacterium]